MFSISRKTKENVSLTVSIAFLLLTALWIAYYATFPAPSDPIGFHISMMLFIGALGGGRIGLYVLTAVTVLAGFLSAANYFRSDRPAVRTASRVILAIQGILTVALAVCVAVAFT